MKWFLTGIGLGAAIGILVAPETGSETRKKLMIRAAKLARNLEEVVGAKSDQLDYREPQRVGENDSKSEMEPVSDGQTLTADPVAEVVNSASQTQLRKVPGIGEATARRIIETRPFESEAQIAESKVMPDAVLKKLKDKLMDTDEGVA